MAAYVRPKMSSKTNPFKTSAYATATFTIGTETSNAITVNVQLKNQSRNNAAERGFVHWFLSDDAAGDTLTATAPDGGVAVGTDGWLAQLVTGKVGVALSEADGDLDVVVTHAAGAKTVYLNLVMPDGTVVTSTAITFA
jgi:hypothetical protein